MADYNQYYTTNAQGTRTYSSPSQNMLNSKIPIIGDYVQFRSGQNNYVLITGNENGGTFNNATVYNYTNNSNTPYAVSHLDSVSYSVSNIGYSYSNLEQLGYNYYGKNDINTAYAVSTIPVALIFSCIVMLIKTIFAKMR